MMLRTPVCSYPIIVTHLSFNFLCLLLLYSIYLNGWTVLRGLVVLSKKKRVDRMGISGPEHKGKTFSFTSKIVNTYLNLSKQKNFSSVSKRKFANNLCSGNLSHMFRSITAVRSEQL
jgi:hypothetical protein